MSMHLPDCPVRGCQGCAPMTADVVAALRRSQLGADGVPEGLALGVTDAQRREPLKIMSDVRDEITRLAPAWRQHA